MAEGYRGYEIRTYPSLGVTEILWRGQVIDATPETKDEAREIIDGWMAPV